MSWHGRAARWTGYGIKSRKLEECDVEKDPYGESRGTLGRGTTIYRCRPRKGPMPRSQMPQMPHISMARRNNSNDRRYATLRIIRIGWVSLSRTVYPGEPGVCSTCAWELSRTQRSTRDAVAPVLDGWDVPVHVRGSAE